MASYNKIILMGNVTRDPDVRVTPGSNTTVAKTGLAVNRKFKEKEEVLFIDIIAFGKTAEIMGEYVKKGNPLLIEGKLSMNSWEQDGVKRIKHEVIIDAMQMLGSRKDKPDFVDEISKDGNYGKDDKIGEEDVPFIGETDVPF